MTPRARRAYLRINYYAGKVFKFFGLCWHCWCRLNYTRNGQGICPDCAKRF